MKKKLLLSTFIVLASIISLDLLANKKENILIEATDKLASNCTITIDSFLYYLNYETNGGNVIDKELSCAGSSCATNYDKELPTPSKRRI